MKILVKLGGTLLDDPASKSNLCSQIARLHASAGQVTVVHGGGKQMTRFLTERGVESKFVNGLRVTSPDVVDALLKVFTGSVNKELASALVAAGVLAVGISGIDAALAEAEQFNPELGQVGRISKVNPEILDTLCAAGFLPVVACVAGDRSGAIYNVNADQMAVACAAGWGADKLFFLTDVDGVRGAGGTPLAGLSSSAAQALVRDGIATGGMQAKLNAACEALENGVAEVVIAPGAAAGILDALWSGQAAGTRLYKG
ncbi:MAG: acetylglutamate kinase [Candidatus Solibacter sp.]|nr:acetylglutamate kinase [Candidatus Solibacter sp.]